MSELRWPDKDPNEKLDYTVDWLQALPAGDAIASVVWTPTPSGLTLSAPTFTASTATTWIESGTAGITYAVACKITTSAGRIFERSVQLDVVER